MLGNIIYVIVGIVVTLIFLKIYLNGFSKHNKISLISILIVITNSLVSLLFNQLNFINLKTLYSILGLFILFYYNKNKNTNRIIVLTSTLLILLIGIISDILVMVIVSNIDKFLKILTVNPIIFQGTCGFLVFVFLYLISISPIPKYINNISNNICNKKYKNFAIVVLLTILTSILGIYCYKEIHKISFRSIIIFIIIVYNFLLGILIIIIDYKKHITNKVIDNLINNNNYYLEKINELDMIKHNLKHHLLGIKHYVSEELQQIFDDLFKEYNVENQNVQNEKLPYGISGLICQKIYKEDNKDISIIIKNDLKTDFLKNISLKAFNKTCSTLCIVLDNAIEASKPLKNGCVTISLYENEKGYTFTISNNFSGLLDVDKFGTRKYSTKENGHGIGLYSILENNAIQIKYKVINDIFVVALKIKKR